METVFTNTCQRSRQDPPPCQPGGGVGVPAEHSEVMAQGPGGNEGPRFQWAARPAGMGHLRTRVLHMRASGEGSGVRWVTAVQRVTPTCPRSRT